MEASFKSTPIPRPNSTKNYKKRLSSFANFPSSKSSDKKSAQDYSPTRKMFYSQEDIKVRESFIQTFLKGQINSRSRISLFPNNSKTGFTSPVKIEFVMKPSLDSSQKSEEDRYFAEDPFESSAKNTPQKYIQESNLFNVSNEIMVNQDNSHYLKRLKTKVDKANKQTNSRSLKEVDNLYDSLSEEEIDFANDSQTFVHPRSKKYIFYLKLQLFAIFSSLLFDSLKLIAFVTVTSGQFVLTMLQALSFLNDFIFIFDFLLHFVVAFKKTDGSFEFNSRQIVINYLFTSFAIFFITSIPFTQLNLFLPNDQLAFSFLFGFRFLRINQNKIFSKLVLHSNLELNRILKFIFVFFFVIHFLSCLFTYLALCDKSPINWIVTNDIDSTNLLEVYIVSLYFHFVSFFTVGYGDIKATNISEFVYFCFLLQIGVLMFAFAISSLSGFFSHSSSSFIQQQTEKFADICSKFNIPQHIKDKVSKSIKETDKKKNHLENFEFIRSLPTNITKKLTETIYELRLKKMKFFKKQTFDFILCSLQMMRTTELNKNDALIGVGDFFEEFYILKQGRLKISLGQQFDYFRLGHLNKYNHFGDVYLFYNQQCSFNLSCQLKHCELYMLSRDDYAKLSTLFRWEINNLLAMSLQKLEFLESLKLVIKEVSKFSCAPEHFEEAARMYKQEYVTNEYDLNDIGHRDDDVSVIDAKSRKFNEYVINKIVTKLKTKQKNKLMTAKNIVPRRKAGKIKHLIHDVAIAKLKANIKESNKKGKRNKLLLKTEMLDEKAMDRNLIEFVQSKKDNYMKKPVSILKKESSNFSRINQNLKGNSSKNVSYVSKELTLVTKKYSSFKELPVFTPNKKAGVTFFKPKECEGRSNEVASGATGFDANHKRIQLILMLKDLRKD